MLFLLRPRQTYMPFGLPRDMRQQNVYNDQLRTAYASTQRVPSSEAPVSASAPASPPDPLETLAQLGKLHDSGVLTDAEFAAAKQRVLEPGDTPA